MARAPETGFYFEPISERLALVVEGSPFPSDDHWAWLGDPIQMTPEQAQLLVGVRWPGVDPSSLEVEFDLNFERAVQAKEEEEREKRAGLKRVPLEFDLDIDQLLAQAQELRAQVQEVSLAAQSPEARSAASEAAAEADRMAALIEQARALAEPGVPGQVLALGEARPQSQRWLHGEEPAPAPPGPTGPAPAARPARAPAVHPRALPPAERTAESEVLIPEIVAEAPRAPPRSPLREEQRGEPGSKPAQENPRARAAKPQRAAEPPPRDAEAKPEPKAERRRPNIRDKR